MSEHHLGPLAPLLQAVGQGEQVVRLLAQLPQQILLPAVNGLQRLVQVSLLRIEQLPQFKDQTRLPEARCRFLFLAFADRRAPQQVGENRTARLRPGVPVQVRQGEQGELVEIVVLALFHVAHQGKETVPLVAERHGRDQAEPAALQHLHNGGGGGDERFVLDRLQVDNPAESLYKGGDLVPAGDRLGKNADRELIHK